MLIAVVPWYEGGPAAFMARRSFRPTKEGMGTRWGQKPSRFFVVVGGS